MRVARDLSAVTLQPSCVTFGVFDGVHLGHQALLERTVETARRERLRAVALTFEPIPEVVLHPEVKVPILTTVSEKRALIESLGIQLLVIARFDLEFSRVPAEVFVRDVLVSRLGAHVVVAGPRTRFGRRARGNLALLESQAPRLGFRVEAVPEVRVRGLAVSSSAVRQSLAQGRIPAANRMLGRPYSLAGRVVRGAGIGRRLGFPTLNLSVPPGKALPAYGVYAGFAAIGGERLPAAINIGERPTFEPSAVAIEAHILSSRVPPRVRTMNLGLVRRLRAEKAFKSPALLVRQMRLDCERARRVLKA
jgi:riboflavin kinase/FMN adenylyltransferase